MSGRAPFASLALPRASEQLPSRRLLRASEPALQLSATFVLADVSSLHSARWVDPPCPGTFISASHVRHCACRQRPQPAALVSSPVPALRLSSPTSPMPLAASATLAMAESLAAAAAGASRGSQATGASRRLDRAPRGEATQREGASRSTATCISTMEALGCTQHGWVHAGLQASERDWQSPFTFVCMGKQHARR